MELGSIGAEVLMVGALGWPMPTVDIGFWRPVFGEFNIAEEKNRAVSRGKTILVHN